MIKKFFWICIILTLISFLLPVVHTLRISSASRDGLVANDVRCARLTDELSELEGVWETAVMHKGRAALVGVRCSREMRDQVYDRTIRLAGDYFPAETCVVGVEDETALEITQLAHLLQSDLPQDVISGRFWYLVNKENSLFDKI